MKNVSVIIPIYKGNYYIFNLIHMLEENWKCVNKLEAVNIEMILINDFPSEKLVINEKWLKNISLVEIVNTCNSGIHFSRVQGFLQSHGDYILFLDQDDIISPVYIREQLKRIKDYDAIICNGKNYSKLIYENSYELDRAIDENEYKEGNNRIVSPGQVLLKRHAIPLEWLDHVLEQNGADDYMLWMMMFYKKCKIGIHKNLLYCHMASGGNTSNNLIEMRRSLLKVVEIMENIGYLTKNEEERIKANKNLFYENVVTLSAYQKETTYKRILETWLTLKEQNITLEKTLYMRNISKIAIYGGGILGKHLYRELEGTNIHVECFIDQSKRTVVTNVSTVLPETYIGEVDAIVVTPVMEFAQIQEKLMKYYSCDIVSLETLVANADCALQSK